MVAAVPGVAGDSAGDARQSQESQECSGAVLGMLQGRDRGCHGAELGMQRQNRESGDLVRRYWGCQGCTAQCRECRGSKGRILDPGVAMGRCWGCKGQCRRCRGAVRGMPQGRSGDAAGQIRGYCRAEPGIPGQSGDSRAEPGMQGQMRGSQGCGGVASGMQEAVPRTLQDRCGGSEDAVG